ncbi:MAG TPA: hypothetical protein VGE07_21285 [Herpetosiphonaceae bacterium]
MPRLAGKRSNTGMYVTLALGLVIVLLILLEAFSVINLLPGTLGA